MLKRNNLVSLREIKSDDFAHWNVLWQDYLKFYQAEVPDDVTKATWDRFFDAQSPISCHVVEKEGQLVAFAVSVVHPSTWSEQDSCYLEDLFVSKDVRGNGFGQQLIQNLIDIAASKKWARVYWHTEADNTTARYLYDKFNPADNSVRYKIDIEN